MARTLLLVVLGLALLIELGLTGGAFFAREFTLLQFGVNLTSDTSFLGYVVAWLLLFIARLWIGSVAGLAANDGLFNPVLSARFLVDWHWHRYLYRIRKVR